MPLCLCACRRPLGPRLHSLRGAANVRSEQSLRYLSLCFTLSLVQLATCNLELACSLQTDLQPMLKLAACNKATIHLNQQCQTPRHDSRLGRGVTVNPIPYKKPVTRNLFSVMCSNVLTVFIWQRPASLKA